MRETIVLNVESFLKFIYFYRKNRFLDCSTSKIKSFLKVWYGGVKGKDKGEKENQNQRSSRIVRQKYWMAKKREEKE